MNYNKNVKNSIIILFNNMDVKLKKLVSIENINIICLSKFYFRNISLI